METPTPQAEAMAELLRAARALRDAWAAGDGFEIERRALMRALAKAEATGAPDHLAAALPFRPHLISENDLAELMGLCTEL
ncbi:MAG TPA: hypothetical protein VNQ79_06780 [Blastocatellia bacterium]|nr:hypothetical protein [Blastocatellia bacterium]